MQCNEGSHNSVRPNRYRVIEVLLELALLFSNKINTQIQKAFETFFVTKRVLILQKVPKNTVLSPMAIK